MDPLISGRNPEPGIVALQPLPEGGVRVYRRQGNTVGSSHVPFYPFIFLTDSAYIKGISSRHWVKELEGNHHFRYLVAFDKWSDLWDAVRLIMERYNRSAIARAESYSDVPLLYLRHDAQAQFLLQTGRTMFKEMEFSDIHRMQLDIETYTRHGFLYSNPDRIEDRIVLIALSDHTGWSHVLNGKRLSEPEMLTSLISIIRERDPDIIEGHNILNYDLPYLLRRYDLHGIIPALGRDGTSVRSGELFPPVVERTSEFLYHEIPGRHLIDTYMLLHSYDASKRSLENYGLKSAAKHFGFAKSDRIYIKGDRISWYWDHEPEMLERYAMDDAEETRKLSDILSGPHFEAAKFLPFPYGTIPRLGASSKVEAMMMREYVHRKHSIPMPSPPGDLAGGMTELYVTGVAGPAIHVSVESLYPAILESEALGPSSDSLGVFRDMLALLFGVLPFHVIPEEARQEKNEAAIRTLIGSFFSALTQARFTFNDTSAAEQATKRGDALLRSFTSRLRQKGGLIIEAGPEGVYLVPSPDIRSEQAERQFVMSAGVEFPAHVRVTVDGRYRKMLSYKKRNHALLTYDDRMKIRGTALSSRAHERYIRNYIANCIDALLNNRIIALHDQYGNLARDILDQRLTIDDVVRTEIFHDSLERYDQEVGAEQRKKQAAYELARQHNIPVHPGERISYYVSGSDENAKGHEHCRLASEWDPNFSDINAPYYLKRLNEASERFAAFFLPGDYAIIFSVEGLFGFSPDGIRVQTVELEPAALPQNEEPEEGRLPPLRIWLAEPI